MKMFEKNEVREIKLLIGFLILILILPVIFADELTDETSNDLNIKGGIMCERTSTGSEWVNYDAFPPERTNAFGENANCRNDIGTLEITCCPSGYSCDATDIMDINGEELYFCNFTSRFYCWHFNSSQNECQGAGLEVGEESAFFINSTFCGISDEFEDKGRICWNETDCSCCWRNNKCDTCIETLTRCERIDGPVVTEGECIWDLDRIEGDCNSETGEGFETYYFTGTETGDYPDDCTEKIVTIPCESVVKLDFFGFFNFISAVLVLIILYIFIVKEKNNYKNKDLKNL